MNFRTGSIRSLVTFGALSGLLLAAGTAHAQFKENTLVGVRLMSSYQDVLKKLGAPSEIQIGAPVVTDKAIDPNSLNTASGNNGGFGRGGLGGLGRGGFGAMGRPGGGLGGFGGGRPGGLGGGALPGGGIGGGTGGPGLGGAGRAGRMGGGRPNNGGFGGFGSLSGAGGLGGFGTRPGASGTNTAPTDTGPEETTWWYHFNAKQLHYAILFNKDGRVIQVQEYGWKGGGKTLAGVGLGMTIANVMAHYPWINHYNSESSYSGANALLVYGSLPESLAYHDFKIAPHDEIAFNIVNNKVLGITIGVVQPNRVTH